MYCNNYIYFAQFVFTFCYRFTAHYLDEEFQLKEVILRAMPLDEKAHTAGNLKEWMENTFESYHISSRVHAVVRDGASNIVCAMKIAERTDFHCAAHRLNLAVEDSKQWFINIWCRLAGRLV